MLRIRTDPDIFAILVRYNKFLRAHYPFTNTVRKHLKRPRVQGVTKELREYHYAALRVGTDEQYLRATQLDPNYWDRSYLLRTRIAFLRLFLKRFGLHVGKLLDVGCGLGEFTAFLLQEGLVFPDSRCVDGSPNQISRGNEILEKLGLEQRIELALAHELPFEANSFDTLVSVHLLHWVTRWQDALREMARVLKPGGKMMLLSCMESMRGVNLTFPIVKKELNQESVAVIRVLRNIDETGLIFLQGRKI